MPIDGDILGLQRRDAPLGELRIGTSVAVEGKSYRKPVRLNAFRFTTSVEMIADAVAALYGGTVAPWEQRRGRWEVITDKVALDVWVPPAGQAVDTNMEMWDGPKRLRQCNGRVERISGEPCSCPRPDDPDDPASVRQALNERHRLAAMRPPRACKPLTRINVTIPDLPGLVGTWRWNTGSENAAVETAGAGDAMTIAREGGVYLPAVATFQWRYRADDGSPYPVPFLMIGVSMRDLAAGTLPAGPGGLLKQLHAAAGGGRRAIGAAETGGDIPPEPPAADASDREAVAQEIADAAAKALGQTQVRNLIARAKDEQAGDCLVRVGDSDDMYVPLRDALTDRFHALAPKGGGNSGE